MNLILTMFGGMLLTAVIYFACRRLTLSNFWAAALSAGLPSAAYIVFASREWPGLDIVTINIIAYPTVAVILYQLYGTKPDAHLHWAPKLLIGFFLILTVLLGTFVYISTNGLPVSVARMLLPGAKGHTVHTGFSGVVEHGEDAARGISQHMKMDATLESLGWRVDIAGVDTLSAEVERRVTISLNHRDGTPVRSAQVAVALARPGQPAPAPLPLQETDPGRYQSPLRLSGGGKWTAFIDIDLGDKHIRLEHRVGGE